VNSVQSTPERPVSQGEQLERVLIGGDLSKLTPEDRVMYYKRVCDSLGLNYLTQPLAYIVLNSRLVLYCKRDATDQLRKLHKVSIMSTVREVIDGVLVVTTKAVNGEGRTDEEIGAVSITGLKGAELANAFMKASTKSKRRVTLSLCGLGWLDETELETIPQSGAIPMNSDTGEAGSASEHPNATKR
jgi:hypothetical protein